MDQEIFEWLLLLGRWLHITVAMAWIGTSIFFMWLDRTFVFNKEATRPGHVGDLWMVHGGGFYHVEKLLMGPTKVPEHLHWFKWESYWTWMSGFFLALMIFYTGHGTFLLDSSVSNISYAQAVALGFFSLVGSWFFYDFLWERRFTKAKPLMGHFLTLLWFAAAAYILCHSLSGRAAYLHTGAMLGTWMTANVFLRIIPRQVKMVEAAKKGEPVNSDWAVNAKHRSTHNTYFTLPVIFIMLSNHFPFTYGHTYNWLILLLISAAGAAIREYFVVRLKKPRRAKFFGALGVVIVLGVMIFSREKITASTRHVDGAPQASGGSAAPIATGEIHGTVRFEGAVPPGQKLFLPLPCLGPDKKEVYSNEVIVTDGKLKNVLVRLTEGVKDHDTPIPDKPAVLDQKGCIYEPRVIGVRAGQQVEFINSDPLFHNVKSITKKNDTFNVAMPNKNDRMIKVFEKPEMVETKCSVHPWMSAFIAVMDHPYFSVTSAKGEFTLQHVPAGDYRVEFWHEVFGSQTKEISLKEGETISLEAVFKK